MRCWAAASLGGFPGSSVPCCAALSIISSSSTGARISRKPTRLKSRPNTLNTSLRRTRKIMEKSLSEAFGWAANSKLFTAPYHFGQLTPFFHRAYVSLKAVPHMNASPPKKSPATVTREPQELELEHQIRLRAHELYAARGRKDGHELDDWLRAEEEITGKKVAPQPPESQIRAKVEDAPVPTRGFLQSCSCESWDSLVLSVCTQSSGETLSAR